MQPDQIRGLDRMPNEMKALWELKEALPILRNDDSLKRAHEFDSLGRGYSYFFKNRKGKVYEIAPGAGWTHAYTEEAINEILVLHKYRDKVMRNCEVQEFLKSDALTTLEKNDDNVDLIIETICATLAALAYDQDWIKELFRSKLEEVLLSV